VKFLVLLVSEEHLLGPHQVIFLFCDFFFFLSFLENSLMLTVGGNAAPLLGAGGVLMKGSYKFDLDEPFTC